MRAGAKNGEKPSRETLDRPILSQSTIRQGADREGARAISHRKRRSIIATTLVAAKRATNKRSPCAVARPQPSAASAESAASSRTPGSIQSAFITHLMWRLSAWLPKLRASRRPRAKRNKGLGKRSGLRSYPIHTRQVSQGNRRQNRRQS